MTPKSLFDELLEEGFLPEDFDLFGKIYLKNDGDGKGDYIAEWNHSNPIPEGFKLGK